MQDLRSPLMRRRSLLRSSGVALASMLCMLATAALAGPVERAQARRMHDRLVGIPPSQTVLDSMEASIVAGNSVQAAYTAMDNPVFYNAALKNFVTPWTNVEQTVFEDLNDYSATVIGIIRDDLPFDQVLYGDILYRGANGVVSSNFSHTNNDHYRQLEDDRVDLSDPAMLIRVTQSSQAGSPVNAAGAAGIMTTRAAAEAFFSAGTNRRMWRFVSMNYLCRDLEDMKDVTRPVDRIRQDVTRSPGGDSSIFLNHCSGCHSGMDPLAGAFAYYEWDQDAERLVYTPGNVQNKHLINAVTFPEGYETQDDRWDNYWRQGTNASLGWGNGSPGGFGAQSLGREVAATRAFAVCQVEKVFSQVCFRPAENQADVDKIEEIATAFETGYSMKQVFADVAVYCSTGE
ncbi:MAG: hypothetical protein QNK04_17680 [Myxococcota bacterium]|nr:hypothetical protein [Myxococcota bacterium]